MSPTAIHSDNHHDSFTLPASNGREEVKNVHASAKRGPEGGLLQVEGEGVVYEAEGVRAKYTDRGADVTSESILQSHVAALTTMQRVWMASTRSSRLRSITSSSPRPKSAESGEYF